MKTLISTLLFLFVASVIWGERACGQSLKSAVSGAGEMVSYQATPSPSGNQEAILSFQGKPKAEDMGIEFTFYPNPAADFIKIVWNSKGSSLIQLRLIDNIGNTVLVKEVGSVQGPNQYLVDLAAHDVRSGIYFLQVQSGTEKVSRKLIVRR